MNSKNTLLLSLSFLLLFICSDEAFSQLQKEQEYYLTLIKPGKKKRIRFYVGEELKFKLKGEKFKRKATITAIDSNSVSINGLATIPLEDFKIIQVNKKTITKIRHIGEKGGIVFAALGGINTLFKIQGSEAMIYGGATSFVLAQILRLFENRNYKLNSYRHLRAVPKAEGLDLERKRSY
ncbi:hypothetical protein [Bernardetia sp.]|uniref:hypothetical protein n=1 Tax=Bernardetia sp. TaxID=1937974 RepID=UPI0025BD4093|nr:hypothetical protein [Bernardetia sp.]